jgi:hypothetical protein
MRMGIAREPAEPIIIFSHHPAISEGTDSKIESAVRPDNGAVHLVIPHTWKIAEKWRDAAVRTDLQQAPAAQRAALCDVKTLVKVRYAGPRAVVLALGN